MMMSVFPKRRDYLCMPRGWEYSLGSAGAALFDRGDRLRKQLISASDLPDLLNCGYETRRSLLERKCGIGAEKAKANAFAQKAMDHGNMYEKEASEVFLSLFPQTQAIGSTDDQVSQTALFVNSETEERVQLLATPDLRLYDNEFSELCLLEIKCPYYVYSHGRQEVDWKGAVLKESHYSQVQYQILTTGASRAYLFYYIPWMIGEPGYGVWEVDPDPQFHEFILDSVAEAVREIAELDKECFPVYRGEGKWNLRQIQKSMSSHCNFLISQ